MNEYLPAAPLLKPVKFVAITQNWMVHATVAELPAMILSIHVVVDVYQYHPETQQQ